MQMTPFMQEALRLARRGYGATSPNPMVGAVLVKNGTIIGRGLHRRAGAPHAEIEAILDAERKGNSTRGATLFVTLEPCSTHGRTPPCVDAIIASGIKRVVAAATDPNPLHAGKGFEILRRAGINVSTGLLASEAAVLNEAFNHWIVHRTPWVTVKAAMSLDGKIATVTGESKWITGPQARDFSQKLRAGMDAIAVGVNTIIKDNPSLTVRAPGFAGKTLRRIILDPNARTPISAKIVRDEFAHLTAIVIAKTAPPDRIRKLAKHVRVLVAPARKGSIDLPWLLKKLGSENVTSLIVEGGGETNASFLLPRLAHRIAFFYAPIILGGRAAPKGVAGAGIRKIADKLDLSDIVWLRFGPDLLLTAQLKEA